MKSYWKKILLLSKPVVYIGLTYMKFGKYQRLKSPSKVTYVF